MNTKAILASTLFTVLFAGTSAMAGDNDHFAKADYPTTTESLVMQKVSLNSVAVDFEITDESGRK